MNTDALAARMYEPVLGRALAGMRRTCMEFLPGNGPLLDCCCGPGGPLLDCCCGPGGLCAMLANAGRHVTGADIDPFMLAQARRNAPGAGFVEADATRLPFDENFFAGAALCLALHAMPVKLADAVFAETLRVAECVVIADYCLPERNICLPAVGAAHAMEWLVGGEHYRNYRAWMNTGALEGMLHRLKLRPEKRSFALGGAVMLALCQC